MFREENIRFISTGGVFDYKIGNSSAMVNCKIGNVLIDCGYTVYPELVERDIVDKIDYLLITHLHGDHVGSIHPLILHLVNKCRKKVKIIYPTESFLKLVQNYLEIFLVDTSKYIEFVNIRDVDEVGFVDTTNQHIDGMESYAYYFNLEKDFIFYSGDLGNIQITESVLKTIEHSNIIVFHETSFIQGKAHVFYKELMDFSQRNKYSVYAYHCNHMIAPEDCNLKFVANQKEFCL